MHVLRSKQSLASILAVLSVMALITNDIQASAPEYIAAEEPVPASVEDQRAPMEEVYPIEEIPSPSVFPDLKRRFERTAPFWRDTRLVLHPRVYYFDRDRDNVQDSVALAYGGWLAYRSGWWRDRVKLGATVYTTQRAHGPNDKDGKRTGVGDKCDLFAF